MLNITTATYRESVIMIDDSKLEALASVLHEASRNEFTGSIQINFFKGSVSNIVKQQSFRMEDIIVAVIK